MNKRTIRIISTLMTICILLMILATSVFAYTPGDVSTNDAVAGGDKVKDLGGDILGIIQIAGTIIAVGVLMVLGVKYMMGSAEEKASYKKTMIPYIVGAVLIFAASNIANMVYDFAISAAE